ncbi:YfiT family bacillithiol transferase [Ascidiimonas sp. W6]|uniref:YfiT family bacillithiol transferase n=1 Tax=Ascidiimonas meishanensis TaxID=3128903 RepID=UPI0030ED0055
MTNTNLEKLQYPIGQFVCPQTIHQEQLQKWISQLEKFPLKLDELVRNLNEDELRLQYRSGGWNIRELVHHLADSHHNSYTRFKWTLTERTPVIKAYNERDWASLFDTQKAPIRLSLDYLYSLHAKLVYLIKGLNEEQLELAFIHPEDNSRVTLKENIGKYAWHGEHHYTHIKIALSNL